jgi:hypothetical protein
MVIDSRIGGMGDIWMRLVALYTLSGMEKQKYGIIIKPSMAPIASSLFQDRFSVMVEGEADVVYTHYGLRHIAQEMIKGKQYVHPFHWILQGTSKRGSFKDVVNDMAVRLIARTDRLLLPRKDYSWEYQGFMELTALRPFANLSIDDFEAAAKLDWTIISQRLRASYPSNKTSDKNIVVFPSGTAHQIMPATFARQYLPKAIFAFHEKDSYARDFRNANLEVVTFASPENMLQLGASAKAVICTDSFPSHLWQTWGRRVLLVLSQQTAKQIVHPGFPREQIIDSMAPCVRCRSRVRTDAEHRCDAEQVFCLTWKDPRYVQHFTRALERELSTASI